MKGRAGLGDGSEGRGKRGGQREIFREAMRDGGGGKFYLQFYGFVYELRKILNQSANILIN